MNPAFLILILLLIACDLSDNDQSQVSLLAREIPAVLIEEKDQLLSMRSDGTVYLDSIMFSGYVIDRYSDGSIKSKKGYYMGKMEGNFTSYYPDGQVLSLRPYHLGEKHGEHLGYYEDGRLKFQYYFENGFGQGIHKEWYKNGDLRKKMSYKDGHEFGPQKFWRPDGKLRSNYVVRENGRKYGMLGLKRCAKIDSKTGDIDPYKGSLK